MAQYAITHTFYIEADSPRKAANEAREFLIDYDHEAIGNIFDIYDVEDPDTVTTIDLDEIEGRV